MTTKFPVRGVRTLGSMKLKTQRRIVGILFCITPLLLLFTFTYLPFGEMVRYSFYDMKYIGEREFVGLNNYVKIFHNKKLWASLKVNLYYIVASCFQVMLALYLATILSFKCKFKNLFKGIFFFPYLVNGIAVGMIFKYFYTHGYVLDTVLQWLGFELENLPFWLRDRNVNNWALVASAVWQYYGQAVIMFIGAIASVDSTLYEAGEIDGANGFQRFRYIILPNIKSIVVLNLILAIRGGLAGYEQPYVMTGGGGGTATYFLTVHKYAHELMEVGMASAMALVLLGIILLVTLVQKIAERYAFGKDE